VARIHRRRFRWTQLGGVVGQFLLVSPRWLAPLLIFNDLANRTWAPSLPLIYVVIVWLVVASLPGRVLTMAVLKEALLGRVRPGRYPRGGRVHLSIWFLERVADTCGLDVMCGTPWVVRYARMMGADVDKDVSLAAEPPILGMFEARSGSSIEADVEIVNWYFDGGDIVIGPVSIGRDVRVGARSCLMPGTIIEDHAEIESGSCITGVVETGERWAGSPAQYVGDAGENWPDEVAPTITRARQRLWNVLYGLSAQGLSLIPVLPAIPAMLMILEIDQNANTLAQSFRVGLFWAPVLALSFLVCYAAMAVVLIRLFGRWVRPGLFRSRSWHAYFGWLSGRLVDSNLELLSSVYSSLFTPLWLRLLGSQVGKNAEIATPIGVPSLLSVGEGGFVADDVFFAQASSWRGWLRVGRVDLGERAFVGNSALLDAGTYVDQDALIAVMSRAPKNAAARSSWIGSPSVEFPRARQEGPMAKTFRPTLGLKVARGSVELVRGILPSTLAVVIAECVLVALDAIGTRYGVTTLIFTCPIVLGFAALAAWVVTAMAKWLVCGRYRPGLHPLWSNYVWRTELVNAMHEHVAGTWLTPYVIGTEIFNVYLRSMGSRIGNDVWCESWSITEFDLVELQDGVSVSKDCDVQTHLFHDRMMSVGAVKVGAGSTIGIDSVVLPEAVLEEDVTIGPKSLVMRGEVLASGTSWQGVPIVAA
jgi:non-ribosomal peptide synthetase-like protein